MANFLLGLIVGSMSKNKSNKYGPKSVTPPKPKLPPIPNKIGTNPSPKSKSPGPPGNNKLIELTFCKEFDISNIEIIELRSYEDFFNFYIENHDKGCIYDVKLK